MKITKLRPFHILFDFCASDFEPIAFSHVNLANRNGLPMRKNRIPVYSCVQGFEQMPRPTEFLVVWHGEEMRWVRCTARRTQASEPRLLISGLVARRRCECARVNMSCFFCVSQCDSNLTDCCCCCAAVYSRSTHPRRRTRRVRFPWSLGPSQPTVVWLRRDAAPADRASGARQRHHPAVSPSNSSIGLLLFAVVYNILNLESMPFFDLKMP